MSNYPSDITDRQWEAIRSCIPPSRPVGVTRQISLRGVVDAIRYRQRSGCPWRLLPHDFPHWRTVYGYDRQWKVDGTWRQIEQALRELRAQASNIEADTLRSTDRVSLVAEAMTSSL